MSKTTLTKEVIVTRSNEVGTLAKVATTFAEGKVNVEACCCYTQDDKTCNFHFVTSDPDKTMNLLRKTGWTHKENPILCVELSNKVGTLADTATKLGNAGVDIDYCYCSTGPGPTTKVFFSTKDNNKALKALG